ncbi:class I SAM-dependent DNA methyltransferase [Latilactobacillus graminis]|uniref:UbiE COQ5 methyltransferase family protein n=2 Tax=Latilactobacillus graminis TaxID=60519 RepID=A0AA89I003_9LACO|nr:class I SAM-dependent methyltransferase [Latilactobacillus graminis]KRM21125.1 ubiE COQ5 methyltransferase family protein [Latilactobacillus graminis DSM 20719]QFP79251.1 class I SAM-dependent methyltransferase [Latilactobacillus graminis]
MIYQSFAAVYDRLMDSSLYEQWRDYTLQTLQAKHRVLELACGTGDLAILLKQAGLEVVGLDLSAEMLSIAAEKASEAAVELPLLQGDMLALDDIGTFEAVTCFDDSICYMPDLAHVQQVFEQVYQSLEPEGQFLFDAHSLYQMDELFPGFMYNDKTAETAFMWTSYVGEVPHSIEHDLSFFVWDEKINGYQALNELHYERTYAISDYVAALKAVGFKDVTVSADFGQEAVQADSVRWFFSAVK